MSRPCANVDEKYFFKSIKARLDYRKTRGLHRVKLQFFGQIRLTFDPGEPPRGGVKILNYSKLSANVSTLCIKLIENVLKSTRANIS